MSSLSYFRPILFSWMLIAGPAFAQTGPAAPDKKSTDVVTLPVFSIISQKDYGYRAANSITATGIGTEIYRTPINVSVVTADMFKDLGALSLREGLQYTSGVFVDLRDPNQVITHGFLAPVLVNRMLGTARNPTAAFIERVEIVKGPNSVFFGRVSPGGTVNVITLRPRQGETFTNLKASYGSYDYKSLTVDHNLEVGQHAALRLAGNSIDRGEGYADYTYHKQDAAYGAFAWDITPKLKLNVYGQLIDMKINDVHSVPRGHPAYLEYTKTNPNVPIATWAAQFLPPGAPYVTAYLDPYIAFNNGWRGSNNGPDAFKKDKARSLHAELQGTPLDWLSYRFAAAFGGTVVQTLEISGFPTINGTYLNQRAIHSGSRSSSNIYEAEAVAKFNVGPSHHQLLAGARLNNTAGGSWSVASDPVTWNNKTQGPRSIIKAFPGGMGIPAFARPESVETAFYAVDQVSFFEDRVKLLAGARHTKVTNKGSTQAVKGPDRTQQETTPQVGILAEPTKGVVMFANYSETFIPQFTVDTFGKLADNVHAKGLESGFKFDLLANKLSASATLFQVESTGEAQRDFLREITLGRAPIFVEGGTKRARGVDIELYYTPVQNDQLVIGYTRTWEAKVISDVTNPLNVGRRLEKTPSSQLSIWNRYEFTKGPMKGVFLGTGMRYIGQYDALLNVSFDLKNPSVVIWDLEVGYATTWEKHPVSVQLNLKNVFDKEYLDGAYIVGDPLTAYVNFAIKF